VIFIFEWTTMLWQADALDLLRLVSTVPRHRRVVLDGDGNYNELIRADGDYNHRTEADRRRWSEICDSLTDKICQPTFHPLRKNVRTFLFYSYNPAWAMPLDLRNKEYGMIYVGHSKFRWQPILNVLRALEPIRARVGRIGLVGYGWRGLPPWASSMKLEEAYYSDAAYLGKLEAEVLDPVPFEHVIRWMSMAIFNPVISRPTFSALRLVTPRFFETPAASTIPVFGLDEAHVEEIYGPPAQHEILADGQPGKDLASLWHVADPQARALVRGTARDVAIAERDMAAARRQQPHDRLEQRGLADAVPAHDADHLALAYRDRDVRQNPALAVVDVDSIHGQHHVSVLTRPRPR